MKAPSLERYLMSAWYEGRSWLVLLRPLSCLYQRIATRRRNRYLASPDAQWHSPVPLVVVGNITLGGTGKTPMTLWLIEHLQGQGLKVGVISRGYGGQPPSFPWQVNPTRDDALQTGDEPLLIARRCQVPVIVDPRRSNAAQHLLENHQIDVIISDDGLQHYPMARTMELVMIDNARGLGNRRCLPEGPLREPPSRLSTVDFVIRNGAAADGPDGYAMQLVPAKLVNLLTGEERAPADWSLSRAVIAVAGIGNPERFSRTLAGLGFEPTLHAFADHATYDAVSFAGFDTQAPLIMTEKDAIKCASFARANWWYLRVDAVLSDAFADAFNARLHLINSSLQEPKDGP